MTNSPSSRLLIRSLPLIPAVFFIFFLNACTPASTELRKEGFDLMEKGFESQKNSPLLNKTVELGGVRIHIVGDRSMLPWDPAKNYYSGVEGYSTSGNDIYLFGKVVDGKITLNQAVLGHELMHLLNFKDPEIADPDTLDHLEMCAAKSGRC